MIRGYNEYEWAGRWIKRPWCVIHETVTRTPKGDNA
jgi:hypothetical protein